MYDRSFNHFLNDSFFGVLIWLVKCLKRFDTVFGTDCIKHFTYIKSFKFWYHRRNAGNVSEHWKDF